MLGKALHQRDCFAFSYPWGALFVVHSQRSLKKKKEKETQSVSTRNPFTAAKRNRKDIAPLFFGDSTLGGSEEKIGEARSAKKASLSFFENERKLDSVILCNSLLFSVAICEVGKRKLKGRLEGSRKAGLVEGNQAFLSPFLPSLPPPRAPDAKHRNRKRRREGRDRSAVQYILRLVGVALVGLGANGASIKKEVRPTRRRRWRRRRRSTHFMPPPSLLFWLSTPSYLAPTLCPYTLGVGFAKRCTVHFFHEK